MSQLEEKFLKMWETINPDLGLAREAYLIPGRRFRFDFVHPSSRVAIEINGGTYRKGAHSTGTGLERDYAKYNLATLNGYSVFQLSSKMILPDWLKLIGDFARKSLPPPGGNNALNKSLEGEVCNAETN